MDYLQQNKKVLVVDVTSCLLFDVPEKDVNVQLLDPRIVEEELCDGHVVSEELESNGAVTVMGEGLDNEF
jgi:hypothetical protein